jgi:multidrug resistance protein, MATE family
VLGSTMFFSMFILGSGFAQAVMPLVATALGAGDETQVRRDTRMGIWLSIGYGILIYPAFWWSETLLLALGQGPDVAALGQDFMRIAGLGMVPALMVMALKSYLAAVGRTQVVLWTTLGAVVVNGVVVWMLIFGNLGAPELGVQGAAIGSVVTQIMTVVVIALYAGWQPALRRYRLWQRFWRPDTQALARVFRLGLPIGLTGIAESGLFHASALMMGWIGTVELAAHGIAMQLASLAFMFHLGLSNAATVRVGHADGAGDGRAVRLAALAAISLSFGFGVVMVTLFLAVPAPIISLFLDASKPESAAIVALGVTLMALAALFQLTDAMQAIALGLLRGLRDTQAPMWYAIISYWVVGIPTSYVLAFPMGLGPVGLWLGLVVGLLCSASSMMIRFWRLAPQRGRSRSHFAH